MSTQFLAAAVGRWVAPLALAAATIFGSLGVSSVASAEERGPAGATEGRHAEEGARGTHGREARRGWGDRGHGRFHGHRAHGRNHAHRGHRHPGR
jgi:hypothetical protein